jgi:hypothetical protein
MCGRTLEPSRNVSGACSKLVQIELHPGRLVFSKGSRNSQNTNTSLDGKNTESAETVADSAERSLVRRRRHNMDAVVTAPAGASAGPGSIAIAAGGSQVRMVSKQWHGFVVNRQWRNLDGGHRPASQRCGYLGPHDPVVLLQPRLRQWHRVSECQWWDELRISCNRRSWRTTALHGFRRR